MAGKGGPSIGNDLPPGTYTFAGLARETGVPAPTLRRWVKEGKLDVEWVADYGHLRVNVFDRTSVDRVRELRTATDSEVNKAS